MSIGENIKRVRKEKGMTQRELGEIIGCAEITIRQYENEKREPKLEQINKIADALEVKANSLYGDTIFTGELVSTPDTKTLIIKCNKMLSSYDTEELRNKVISDLKEGVVVLPEFVDYEVVDGVIGGVVYE